MTVPDISRFTFACCFCNEDIESDSIFTVVLIWPPSAGQSDEEDASQSWWCHRDCFVKSLHPVYRQMRDEDDLDDLLPLS